MNKKEATKTIDDFIRFNSFEIAELYNQEPALATVFGNVLNVLSKEYGSGEDVIAKIDESKKLVEETLKVQSAKKRQPQDVSELKIGDRVYLPDTKKGDNIQGTVVYTEAVKRNQPYLYVTDIDDKSDPNTEITLSVDVGDDGDFYRLKQDKIKPYPGNLLVGDSFMFPASNQMLKITKFVEDAVYFETPEGNENSISTTYLIKRLLEGDANWYDAEGNELTYDAPTEIKAQREVKKTAQKPKVSGGKLVIETIPALVEFHNLFAFDYNTGNRNSPTQSAGELYRYLSNRPITKDVLETLYKGNDQLWYKLVPSGKSWVWKKATQGDVNTARAKEKSTTTTSTDYANMTKKELKQMKEEIEQGMGYLAKDDPEYMELESELKQINNLL